MRSLFAVVVLALAVASTVPAFAQEPLPSDLAPAVAPIAMTPAEIAALIKAVQASAPAPASQPAAAPVAKISAEGVMGFSWTQIFGGVGGLLSMALGAFAVFKTAGWLKARRIAEIAAEGAYHVAERLGAELGLEGAQKTALAIKAFYEAMTGRGITVISQSQVEAAKVTWTAMAAQAGPAAPCPAPVPPAALAAAQAAAKVATSQATATQIADELAKP